MESRGKLFCVGVGPGDPELITLKAKKIIEESDVIFAPVKSVKVESFALETVRKVVEINGKEIIRLVFPMTTKEEKARPYWEEAWKKIKEKVLEGKKCVFVVEGDPLIYSTFNYVLEMANNEKPPFDIEIIPGISSFQLMSAKVKFPVADGDDVIVIMPASLKEKSGCRTAELRDDFKEIISFASSIFILKSGRVLGEIYSFLRDGVGQNGTEQRSKINEVRQNENQKFLAFFGELCGTENEFISELNPEILERKNHYFSIVFLKRNRE